MKPKMLDGLDEQQLIERINALAREEHELFERESNGTATEEDIKRLHRVQRMLDETWVLLRHWRAAREFGVEPDETFPPAVRESASRAGKSEARRRGKKRAADYEI